MPDLCSVSISGCREDTVPFGHPAINQTKNNYKTILSITKSLNWDWLFAMQFLEC